MNLMLYQLVVHFSNISTGDYTQVLTTIQNKKQLEKICIDLNLNHGVNDDF